MKETQRIDLKQFGQRIREARLKMKMSQAELADACSMSPSHLSDIENGKKCIGIDVFLRLAEVLQVSTDWLLRPDVPGSKQINNADAAELLEDCSADEAALLLELMANIKSTLRKGKK